MACGIASTGSGDFVAMAVAVNWLGAHTSSKYAKLETQASGNSGSSQAQ